MTPNRFIYLDNAATSFPKPEIVYQAVDKALREESGNPGRSNHRLALSATRVVDEARMFCARLFHVASPDSIVFTNNTTTALNMAIRGTVSPGDHVITSSLEHNSVTRPLKYLADNGIEITKIPTDLQTGLSLTALEQAVQKNTKLVVCTHISNVTGTVNDIAAIGDFCQSKGILFLVDGAQSAGMRPIDVQKMKIDLFAFPGHKGLLGPQGTGGLYIRPGLEIATLLQGGTGSVSESLEQPHSTPGRYESGTLNIPGLAGLAAGVRYLLDVGISEVAKHEKNLTTRLIQGIARIPGITLIGPNDTTERGNPVSICFDRISVADAALMMDAAFSIAVRGGLHCSADAHQTMGTLESGGTLRISPGYLNTIEEIEQCLEALAICAKGV